MSMQYRSSGGNYMAESSPYHSGALYTNTSMQGGTAYTAGYPTMPGSNGSGFTFRKRIERVDWKKIAAADLDQISHNLDFNSLQENIMNITFCNIESELEAGSMDPHFVKLFKLGQLTIEYLLHSQDYLSGMVAALDEKFKNAIEEHGETEKIVEKQKAELAEVKKESHKRKKLLVAQQQILNAGVNSYHKCPYCPKAFVNTTFLQSHLQRRHTEQTPQVVPPQPQPAQSQMTQSHGQVPEEYKVLERELDEIKERLRLTESQLVEERNNRNSLSLKEEAENAKKEKLKYQEMEAWKTEQFEAQMREFEGMRKLLMKEVKEANEKYASAMIALENQKKGRSNLGEMEDETTEEKSQLRKQREEVAVLREHLSSQVAGVEAGMASKLEEQEARWREKVKEMAKQHRKELSQLNNSFESSIQGLQGEKEGRGKLEKDYDRKMAEMQEVIKQSREQERKLNAQEKQIEEIARKAAAPVAGPRPPVQSDKPQQGAPPVAARPMSPEHDDDDEDDDDDETSELEGTSTLGTTGIASGPFLGSGTLSLGTGTINSKSIRLLEQLKQDPSLLRALKEELQSVLEDNLERRGIPKTATGISTGAFTNKLSVLKNERQQLAKKFSNFYDIRQQYIRQVDEQAKEQLRSQKQAAGTASSGRVMVSKSGPRHMPPRPVSPSRPMSPSRPISPTRGMGHRPRPAPRATSPQGKMATTSTMSSTGTYGTTTGASHSINTWGTTTASSSSHWDSDNADSDDVIDKALAHGATGDGPQRRNVAVVMADEEEEEDITDWDDGSILEETPRATVQRVYSSPQPRGKKVAQLRDTIESQLAKTESPSKECQPGRKGRGRKPAGGVSMVDMEDDKSQQSKKKDDSWDDEDDFSVSSLEDTASAPPSRVSSLQRKLPATRGSHQDTDISTAGTSVWGSSKDKHKPQPSPRRTANSGKRVTLALPVTNTYKDSTANRGGTLGSGGRTSVMSLSDFDEDEDFSND